MTIVPSALSASEVMRMKRFFAGLLVCVLFVGGALLPLFVLATHNSGLPHAPPQESGISVSLRFGVVTPPALPGPRPVPPFGAIIFGGFASPRAFVVVERDGAAAATTSAGVQGVFEITLTGILEGTYDFRFSAEDIEGNISESVVLSAVPIFGGATTTIENILLPPTIVLGQESIFPDASLQIHGYTVPGSNILAFVGPGDETFQARALVDGFWEISIPGIEFSVGEYTIQVSIQTPFGLISIPSLEFPFRILSPFPPPEEEIPPSEEPPSEEPLLPPEEIPEIPGAPKLPPPPVRPPAFVDLNGDGRVDLIDLSILLYNWGEPKDSRPDFNRDGIVDLVDFSIMMFWWTA